MTGHGQPPRKRRRSEKGKNDGWKAVKRENEAGGWLNGESETVSKEGRLSSESRAATGESHGMTRAEQKGKEPR